METYFNTIFGDVRYERSLISSLSPVEPNIMKQSRFTVIKLILLKILLLRYHIDKEF